MGWPLTFGRASLLDNSNHETLRLLARLAPLAPGARVLLAGFDIATSCSGIAAMGLHVTASVDLDAQVDALVRNAPEIDSIIGPGPRKQFTDLPPDFDLVVLDVNESKRRNLLSRLALMETASLLASLRPGGMLMLYGDRWPDRAARPGHSVNCCLSHLGRFPGRRQLHQSSGHHWTQPGNRILPFAATLTIPHTGFSPIEWDSFAQDANGQPGTCCDLS